VARGKRSVALDLKDAGDLQLAQRLIGGADVLVDPYRPGVTERLGIGPDECLARNPRLVYARMTGWGQDGPLSGAAGHDLNYIALAGALHPIGSPDAPPPPPLNLLGDYGGGGMLLAVGVLAALRSAALTGVGQVVDASIVDGSALLATQVYGLLHSGLWTDRRGANLLDGAAPNYTVYETADGRHLAVGPLESRFWAEFAARLGIDGNPADPAGWPSLRKKIAERIASRTRDEWLAVFDGSDACVAPVLSLTEAASNGHPQLAARGTFVEAEGVRQPAPAPRFSGTPAAVPGPPPYPGQHTREALTDWGVGDVDGLLEAGVAYQADRP
jgi:alpha-methylacyl-CoA racemase